MLSISMKKLPLNPINELWTLPARSERVFSLRINHNIVITLLVSVLLHLSLIWIFAPKLFSIGAPIEDAPPLKITLGPPQKEEIAPSRADLPSTKVTEKAPNKPKRKPIKSRPSKQRKAPVEVAKDSTLKMPKKKALNKTRPQPKPKETSAKPLPGEDMQAYVRRQKLTKLAKQGLSEEAAKAVIVSNNPQSEGDKRDAKIKATLNLGGTNGVFEIRRKSANKAQFSFKGWKSNINTARLEIIDVLARDGEDINRAIVRSMIRIIRRDYDGHFKWESRRLGRVLTLSARMEDTAGLEDFLMQEFFSPGSRFR